MFGWQRLRKRELPPLEKKKKKKTTLATAVAWYQGSHSPTAAPDALPDQGRAIMSMLSPSAASKEHVPVFFLFCFVFISHTKPASNHQLQAIKANGEVGPTCEYLFPHTWTNIKKLCIPVASINLF